MGDLVFGYISLILAQLGITGKQFAMKNCGKLAPGPFNSVCINMMRSAICLAVSLCIWLLYRGAVTNFWGHIIIIISGLGTALNLFTWILASRITSLTLIECLSMIGAMVFPMIIAPYLYNGESVSLLQWIGCILVFVSVFFFMNNENSEKEKVSKAQKTVIIFLCVLGITLSSIGKKYYVFHFYEKGMGSVEYFTFINFVTIFISFITLFCIYYIREKKRIASVSSVGQATKVELPYKKVWIFVLVAAASLYVNELFTGYASRLPSAIYYPLSRGLTVVCTFILDFAAFKDKVTLKKLIGLAIVVCAIILVNL